MTSNTARGAEETVTVRAWPETGEIEATVTFEASPERVFRALTTKEICDWWVRPGVFDTREWSGDLREGGMWKAAGVGGGKPYALEGEFVEIDEPRRLVHTWRAAGAPGGHSRVTYDLAPQASGVCLTLRHRGIGNPDLLENTRAGWATSFDHLRQILASERTSSPA